MAAILPPPLSLPTLARHQNKDHLNDTQLLFTTTTKAHEQQKNALIFGKKTLRARILGQTHKFAARCCFIIDSQNR